VIYLIHLNTVEGIFGEHGRVFQGTQLKCDFNNITILLILNHISQVYKVKMHKHYNFPSHSC